MFDRYVEERRRASWSRRSLIGVSIFGHAAVGLFLFAVTLFTVDEIRPPALAIVFLKAPPPPAALPPAFGRRAETPRPKPVVKPTRPRPIPTRVIVQPQEKPPEAKPEPPKEEDEEEGDPEGVVGGSKEGIAGGKLDGVEGGIGTGGNGVGPPAAEPPPPPKPKMVAAFVFDRERLKYPDPHLPQMFLQTHANQTVKGMYRICVDTAGAISKMETVTSLSGADQTIIEQVSGNWQYKPQPVPVCTIRVFEFHIN
jgi:hypothetical protein